MLTVVIVNWNSGQLLQSCVDSVKLYGEHLIDKCIVVDNGSVDNSLEFMNESDENLLLIKVGNNAGFAKACNLGAMKSESPYLLFLNPDAMLMDGCLEAAIQFMEQDTSREVGICGIQLLGDNNKIQRHCVRFPTFKTYFSHALGLTALFPRKFPSHFMQDFDHCSSREVDHVIGAFFLVRRSVFEQLNGFDERYFVYLEDLDFSLRARMAGWKTHYLADATAYHKGGGTSDQVKAHRLFYSLRSRIIYCFRHFSRPAAWGVVTLTMLVEPWPRLARALLRCSWQEARDTCRGYGMLWKDLPATLRKARING